MIQNFIRIQQNVVSSSSGLMTKSSFYSQILEVSVESLKVQEYNLQRELLNFFKTFFLSGLKQKAPLAEEYLKAFWTVFPDLPTTLFLRAAEVFQNIYESFPAQENYVTGLLL